MYANQLSEPELKIKINKLIYLLNKEDKTASLIDSDYYLGDVFIPRSINYESQEYIITSIKKCALCGKFNLFEVIISPDSQIQTIEKNAFASTAIQRITIPPSITELKEGWCKGTHSLTNITVMDNNPVYASYEDKFIIGKSSPEKTNYDVLVFATRDIEHAIIPDSIEIIESSSFSDCENLKTVIFPSNSKVRIIKKHAFDYTKINCISIPPSVTQIGKNCFFFSKFLQKVEIPKNSKLQIIEKNAFCFTKIDSILIPPSLTELKEGWCKGTHSLTNITVMDNNPVYALYEDKFIIGKSSPEKTNYDVLVFATRDIEHAIIPNFIEIIEEYAFDLCKNLKVIQFASHSKLKMIKNCAFSGSGIENIEFPQHLSHIGEYSFSICDLKKVEFPINSELKTIEKKVFYKSLIESLTIPPSIVELKKGWCEDVDKLSNIKVDPNNSIYKIYDNKFLLCKSSPEKDNYDILVFAFRDIKTAKIPDFIEIIGPYSFELCEQIQTVEFTNNSKLRIIDDYAFKESSIKSIKFPIHLESICENAFSDCNNLHSVEFHFDCELKTIGKYAFANSSIEILSIPNHVNLIDEYAFSSCNNLKRVDIGINSELQTIGDYAFDESSIESISIPIHLKSIGNYSFNDCENLSQVEIPTKSELQMIGKYAFINTSIESFYIPSHLKEIGKCAFNDCSKLQKIEVSMNSQLQVIGKSAFANSEIESFIIPSNVKQIEKKTFYSCKNLRNLEIQSDSKLQSIEMDAFNKTQIEKIYIPSSIIELKEGWCSQTPCLNEIEVDTKNQHFCSYDNNKMIIGKSSKESKDFDVLVFCARNISNVIIPSFVKIIDKYAFDMSKLRTIKFSSNSQLEIINSFAFSESLIESISIPPLVTQICDNAFSSCHNLFNVEISNNSKLKNIGKYAFESTSIESIFIPANVEHISQYVLSCCIKLQIIEIDENSKLKSINSDMFNRFQNAILMVSFKANISIQYISE